jgi:hypothetical protein
VTVNALPTVAITGGGAFCAGSTITLDAGAGFSAYIWSPGGETTRTINPDNTTTGTKTYSVKVTDGNGCSNTTSTTVTIKPVPTVNIIGGGSYCAGTDITLDAGGVVGDSYLWSTTETTQTINPDNSTVGTFTYSVTVTGANGCSASNSTIVTIKPLPVVNITGGGPYCQGSTITLDAGGVSGDTYLWSTGATTQQITPSSSTAGTTTYTVTITSANGCSATNSTDVRINALPTVDITGGGAY